MYLYFLVVTQPRNPVISPYADDDRLFAKPKTEVEIAQLSLVQVPVLCRSGTYTLYI